MNKLEQFSALLQEKAAQWGICQAAFAAEQAAFDADIEATFRQLRPESNVNDLVEVRQALSDAEFEALKAPRTAMCDALWERKLAREEELEAQLVDLAAELEIPTLSSLELRKTFYGRSPSGQIVLDAEAEADIAAAAARALGLRAEVRIVQTHDHLGHQTEPNDYGVFANTSQLGWEITRRSPQPGTQAPS